MNAAVSTCPELHNTHQHEATLPSLSLFSQRANTRAQGDAEDLSKLSASSVRNFEKLSDERRPEQKRENNGLPVKLRRVVVYRLKSKSFFPAFGKFQQTNGS